jgi:NAD(P)-dependent dehydrogenase (short-subunit alcohol dehydrogenase family)
MTILAGGDFMTNGLLEEKVAWVTGAGRGAGRAVAEGLAEAGAKVILHARSADELATVQEKIRAGGGDAEVFVGDVSDEESAAAAVDLGVQRWGRLDVLVNNAGISPVLERSERLDTEVWRRVLDVNLTGAFLCARAAADRMLQQGSGSIVNMSSVHGSVGFPRLAAYSASKGSNSSPAPWHWSGRPPASVSTRWLPDTSRRP